MCGLVCSFADTIVDKLKDAKQNNEFCPLADVPDVIWKNNPRDVHIL